MSELSEVCFSQSEQCRTVKLRVSANVVVRVRVKWLSITVLPNFFGVVASFNVDGARAPVFFLARHIISPFDQKDALARRS